MFPSWVFAGENPTRDGRTIDALCFGSLSRGHCLRARRVPAIHGRLIGGQAASLPAERGEESVMSANKKRERQAVTPPNRRHLDNLLDQALADSFPASDPVAINFDSPGDWQASEERGK